MLIILFLNELRALDIVLLCNLSSLMVLFTGIWLFRIAPRGLWSASVMYFAVFCLFHFGMTFVTGLNAPIYSEFDRYRSHWFFTDFTSEAVVLSTSAMLAIALGVRTGLIARSKTAKPDPRDDQTGRGFMAAGFLLMVACIFAWFSVVIAAGGTSILVGAYRVLLDSLKNDNTVTMLIYYGLGLASIFLAAAPASGPRRAGFWIFAAWAAFALPLGLRGEVMFPACTAVVVASQRKPPFTGRRSMFIAAILLMITLSGIAFIRGYRQVGLSGISTTQARFSPLDALAEMGASIRPVSLVVQWRAEGDEFLYGGSYWAPFDRALGRILPGWETTHIDASDDERLLNILIKRRESSLGFSPVAEAYRNFGPIGVPIVMFFVGWLLGIIDRLAPTRVHMAFSGLLFFPMLYQVRNAFVPIPAQFFVGCVFLMCVLVASRTAHFTRRRTVDTVGAS